MPSYRAVSVCLCSHQCGPKGRHFSFLRLLLCSSWPVTWSPAHNCTSVCGSTVACETFGQEASANGWQPLHIAWFCLMRCPWVPQASDKLPCPHCHLGPEQSKNHCGPAPISACLHLAGAPRLGGWYRAPEAAPLPCTPLPSWQPVISFTSTWRLSLREVHVPYQGNPSGGIIISGEKE